MSGQPYPKTVLALTVATLPMLLGVSALADTLRPDAPVVAATLFPSGAQLTREVTLNAPAGRHQVILAGLPADTDADSLRIGGEGVAIASFAVQNSRALPDIADESPALQAARKAVDTAQADLAEFEETINMHRAEVETRQDMIAIYTNLGKGEAPLTADAITTVANLQDRITTLRRDIVRLETEIAAMEPGRRPYRRKLDQARATLDALLNEDMPQAALVLEVVTSETPAQITVQSFASDAGWAPVYDLHLDTQANRLRLDRGVLVRQSTGEDWTDIQLRLSTARPSGQIRPSPIGPLLVRAEDEAPPTPTMAETSHLAAAPMARAQQDYMPEVTESGPVLRYDYTQPVTIRTGSDALRLTMESTDLSPEIRAQGNAARDATAFLYVEAVNDGALILPGAAQLYADGVMVGRNQLELTATGEPIEQGFGPIDGITIERRTPRRQNGERGLIRRSNALEDEARIVVTNHTDREWGLMLTDHMPVAEQKDVTVEWQADPAPDRTAPKDKRGVVEWDLTLGANSEQVINISTRIGWPSDKVLRGYPG